MSFKHLKYYPELNEVTGSVYATVILLQLEYWFIKSKGNKFYKFLDRCEHRKYRQGDSWVEELGFSKHEFRTAFKKIGKAYKSKKAFEESDDLFEGRYYASYYDRIKGLTYYIRNDQAVERLLNKGLETNTPLAKELPLQNEADSNQRHLGKSDTPISVSSNRESRVSVEYNNKLTTVKDRSLTQTVPYERLKELFNTYCVSYPNVTVLTPKRKAMLKKLWQDRGQTLESFKKVFVLAEDSDFLSGRKGKWQAHFDWLIQEDKFIAILEGAYANGYVKEKGQQQAQKLKPQHKFLDMYTHNFDFNKLEQLEEKYIDAQVARLQMAAAAI